MDWTGASETVAGLCLRNKLDPNAVNPASLQPPYDTIVRLLREGKQEVDILEQVNMQPIFVAKDAADAFAGAAGDAVELAERASVRRDAGKALLPIARQLERGQDGDVAAALSALSRLERGHREFTTLTETDPEEDIFVPTFYQPIDKYMGGIPDSNMTIVAGGTGVGKAQPLWSNILTPSGWKQMSDIEVGDGIFDRQGQICSVLGVFPQGKKDVYRVFFSDGTFADSTDDHLWIVQTYKDRAKNRGWKTIPLSDIRGNLYTNGGRRRYFIPLLSDAVDFEESDLPIEPYTLGVLLGDGTFRQTSPMISAGDTEVLDQLVFSPELRIQHRAAYDYAISGRQGRTNPLMSKIEDLGLKHTYSHEKFIPEEYLFSSIEQRITLLQGLMDTDGCISKGRVEFYSSSRMLAEGVQFIVESLGGIARLSRKKTTHRPCYRVNLTMPKGVNPFRLSRKAGDFRGRPKNYRGIERIEYLGKFESQCVMTSSDDGSYLTDHCIVTHNTTFLTELAISAAKHDKKTAIFSLEMTTGQIHRRVIELDKDITERQKERILITDGVYDVHEVYATASRLAASHPDLHWIGIDYADYMVRGKQDEQSMGEIYSTISILAKKLGMPVILLAQYRRTDQEPTINDIKYSGRAEQSSGMIMLLWNPGQTFSRTMDSTKLPRVEGRAYIILGKSRFRSSSATLHGTGAVQVEWIEDGGRWGNKGLGEWSL